MSHSAAANESEPIACSLGPDDLETRLREWSDLRQAALIAESTEGNVNTTLWERRDDVLVQLERLVNAERQCCSFLGFDLSEIENEIRLETTFPRGAEPMFVHQPVGLGSHGQAVPAVNENASATATEE